MRTTWMVAAVLATGRLAACAVGPVPGAGPTPPVTGANAEGQGFGLLTDVRLTQQDGADRIVFEFATAVPGYSISYADLPVMSDPAGQIVPLAGTGALRVSLQGASAHAEPGDPQPTYTGPDRLPPGAATRVTEIVKLGDFERVLIWAAGVTTRTGFRVTTLTNPPRLVIDIP